MSIAPFGSDPNRTSDMTWTRIVFRRRAPALVVALAWAGAQPAAAQRYSHRGLREVRDLGAVGANLVVAVPTGDFARNVDVAGGVDVFAALNVGSPLALRLEGSYLAYGSDRWFVTQTYYPLSITTTYSIATFGIGPQITIGEGPVRLYGFGTVGASYLWASSSYRYSSCACDVIDSGLDFDDWTTALQGGGGLLLRLRSRHAPIALDLGARYLSNESAWYVVPGGVVPQSDGSVVVSPIRSRADLVTLHLGVSIGLR